MAWNALILSDCTFHLALLTLLLGLAWYDSNRSRVPNTVTIPLFLAFMLMNWPGAAETWLGCIFLFIAWKFGVLGGGDAKLWMGLLWIAPPELGRQAFLVMVVSFLLTALFQLAWRRFRRQPVTGHRSPAAWRAIPYALWLLFFT